MRDTFQILAKFLERFGDEVEGRELQEPTDDVKVKLHQLAHGTLPESQRGALFALLHGHPHWLAWLAREVKAMREANPGGTPSATSA